MNAHCGAKNTREFMDQTEPRLPPAVAIYLAAAGFFFGFSDLGLGVE